MEKTVRQKKLSNPFSTGGGGGHFEAHVQASFVTLMLTGGHAPHLPCWPVKEVKLQGKVDGFNTDDLIVYVEDINSRERRKLLGQVKHKITITQGDDIFGEVIQAAWSDFNNPEIFTKNKDVIALITGPISAVDSHNTLWILNQARRTKDHAEFFRNVSQTNFSPAKCHEKLNAFKYHLKLANGGTPVTDEGLYAFLKSFYLLGYDLGNESGVALSLLHSHISQFQQQYPQWIWSRVVDIVQTWNKDAGSVTLENLPEDLQEVFYKKTYIEMPLQLKKINEIDKQSWSAHPDATYLSLITLIGSWQENSQHDIGIVTQFLGISYDDWYKKAQEILHLPDSPLVVKNGVWKIVDRQELWIEIGDRVLDKNLDEFKRIAISVLKESNPAFELPANKRYYAALHDKVHNYSQSIREGISEGIAMLANLSHVCKFCTIGKVQQVSQLIIHELLWNADWHLWGSLSNLLPELAEAAPEQYLNAIENALQRKPCPFNELLSQEGDGMMGRNYLTGLLWSLEALAWDTQFLVRVCVILGEIASYDPGGQWANRPSNSLVTILLPWRPQTIAPFEKRMVAVETLMQEFSDIAWDLIICLLPNLRQISYGAYKPKWRNTIPENWDYNVTDKVYRQQISSYAELAVKAAGLKTNRLTKLIDHIDSLPKVALDQFLNYLSSEDVTCLPESERMPIWSHLTKLIYKHSRFSDTDWALSRNVLTELDVVAEKLAPQDPLNLYQHIFSSRELELYTEKGNWEEQRRKLDDRREAAVQEIYKAGGVDKIIEFAKLVSSPEQVGRAVGSIPDVVFEEAFFPNYITSENGKLFSLVRSFSFRRYQTHGILWCDNIDKTEWTSAQIGQFFALMPFTHEVWERVADQRPASQSEYWTRVDVHACWMDTDFSNAIDKLIDFGRPHAAMECLMRMRYEQKPIINAQCIRALLAATSSKEPAYAMDSYNILELIKYLQDESSVDIEELYKIEWAYVSILDKHSEVSPKLLQHRLASEPDFFCEIIRLAYRSKNDERTDTDASETVKNIATNAWNLLYDWKIPPGTLMNGAFSDEDFTKWLSQVKKSSTESGHIDVALSIIGEVLIYTPADPDGLWIRRVVAAALNERDSELMRDGFSTATFNSRGIHSVDPTGQQEKDLAELLRTKADAVENANFSRFAATLRNLARGYDQEAERVMKTYEA